MRKSIGILYICTGPYVVFWKDFFDTFEKNFLPDIEKKYYVFTDQEEIYAEDCERVQRYPLEPQPWPLVTLLRFHTFLSIREELEKEDYLMFSNANMICDQVVTKEEFLPRIELGETMAFTKHPGYCNVPIYKAPLDRNRRCKAYVPYNCGTDYVIGAMFNGTAKSFLSMCDILKERINDDLKRNVIARWHDESHINRYIVNNKKCRILTSSYCYPFGFNLPIEKKISAVDKQSKFDVKTFKGQNHVVQYRNFVSKVKDVGFTILRNERIGLIIDTILKKKIEKI